MKTVSRLALGCFVLLLMIALFPDLSFSQEVPCVCAECSKKCGEGHEEWCSSYQKPPEGDEDDRISDLKKKGDAAYQNGNWKDAIRDYQEALKLSPKDAVIQQSLQNAIAQQQEAMRRQQAAEVQGVSQSGNAGGQNSPDPSTTPSPSPNKHDILVRLKGGTSTATPIVNTSGILGRLKGGTSPAPSQPADWPAKSSLWIEELSHINSQIATTRLVLSKLNESILADRTLFGEWEKEAGEGFDRCVLQAANAAIDFSAGYFKDKYEHIYGLALKLPNKPEAVIEKYRYLASLFQRFSEAKATYDLDDLAKREGKTDAEVFETLRDGIGQISGLLGLDKTLPGYAWKYGSLGWDMAYNLAELRLVWKNVSALEANNVRYAQEVMVLSNRMRELVERQRQLVRNIEAGEPLKKEPTSE